jgi:hypothetical protein
MAAHAINRQQSSLAQRLPRAIAVVGGASFVALGAWAMVGPRSFFDAVATFEPYNRHFLQDIGAFQIGLGVVLLLTSIAVRADGLAAALLGVGVAAALHAVSHVVGHDLGGTPETDIPFFTAVAILLLAAGAAHWRYDRASER